LDGIFSLGITYRKKIKLEERCWLELVVGPSCHSEISRIASKILISSEDLQGYRFADILESRIGQVINICLTSQNRPFIDISSIKIAI
jgi:hypothetical protein